MDAGGSLLFDQAPATATQGATSVEAMNLLGYDVLNLGLNDLTLMPLVPLQNRIQEAEFPIISANAYQLATGNLVTEPYAILERDSYAIGVIGVSEPGEGREMGASDPLEALREWLPKVREQADIVILLSHAGVDADAVLAQELKGIDLIVSGRNRVLDAPMELPSGTVLVHADYSSPGNAGERVGIADIAFSKRGALASISWQKITLDGDIETDQEMSDWVNETLQQSANY